MDTPETTTPPTAKKKRGEPKTKRAGQLTKADKEARQGLMLAQKLSGKYVSSIAKAFGVSTDVVYAELREAQRKQLHAKAVAFISYNLMPKALAVFAAALDKGDKDIAIRVLEGLGILGRGGAPGMLQVNLGGEDVSVETFEAWRISVARGQGAQPPAPPTNEEVVEGRVVRECEPARGIEGGAEIGEASDHQGNCQAGVAGEGGAGCVERL